MLGHPPAAPPPALTVVAIQPRWLVLDKPAGLLCVPGRGADKQDCLLTRAQQRWPQARVVHRLDQATSGLVVFALDADAQRQLSRLFERRLIDKRYEAVVWGQPSAPAGLWQTIDLPIGRDWQQRPRRRIQTEGGQPSQTRWCVLGPGPLADTTRVALQPLTGRTHQLRLHLSHLGWPIVGDALYGAAQPGHPRLLLHACALGWGTQAAAELDAGPAHWVSPVPF